MSAGTFACLRYPGPRPTTHIRLPSNTRSTYAAGIRRYTNFCKATKLRTLPASESTLILFVTHLATSNISQATIKVYLSAVRHVHVLRGLHNSFSQQLTPRLQIILKGIKKHQAISHPPRVRLPITIHILKRLETSCHIRNPLTQKLCSGEPVVLPFLASCVSVSLRYLV